jgi:hypothetical protein
MKNPKVKYYQTPSKSQLPNPNAQSVISKSQKFGSIGTYLNLGFLASARWFLSEIPALVATLLSILILLGIVWLIIRLLPYIILSLGILILALVVLYFIWRVFRR